jgi:hypothetical protein
MQWILGAACITAVLFATPSFSKTSKTSLDLTEQDQKKTYLIFKHSFSIPKDLIRVYNHRADRADFQLLCLTPGEVFGGSIDDQEERYALTNDLSVLAYEMLYMSTILRTYNYPEKLWKKELSDYEQKSLKAIATRSWPLNEKHYERELVNPLIEKLDSYRKAHKSLVEIFPPSCTGDAGGASIVIKTSPTARRIQYISLHFVHLCQGQKVDFKDQGKCAYWMDFFGEETALSIGGSYIFMITWSTGEPAYRTFNLDEMNTKAGEKIIKVSQ